MVVAAAAVVVPSGEAALAEVAAAPAVSATAGEATPAVLAAVAEEAEALSADFYRPL